MHCNCGCYGRIVFCRICKKYVLDEPERWACKAHSYCGHDEGYAKKDRFQLLSDSGYWRIRDDERETEHAFDNDVRKEHTLLRIINELAFELDYLKRELVKERE